jgi:hypothetical protein
MRPKRALPPELRKLPGAILGSTEKTNPSGAVKPEMAEPAGLDEYFGLTVSSAVFL